MNESLNTNVLKEDPSSWNTEEKDTTVNNKQFFDAHCHYSFAPCFEQFSLWAEGVISGAFVNTVSLQDYLVVKEVLSAQSCFKVGLGAHPWWVSRGIITEEHAQTLKEHAAQERFIGEVGLDFGRNGLLQSVYENDEETKSAQLGVLQAILEGCASKKYAGSNSATQSRMFSFHAVQSADIILDLLTEYKLLPGNTVIFHWFSGSNPQLRRALDLGCYFSLNINMLRSKRGQAYAKAIPLNRLLIESDLPEENNTDNTSQDCFENVAHMYIESLKAAHNELITLRGPAVVNAITQNVSHIFTE